VCYENSTNLLIPEYHGYCDFEDFGMDSRSNRLARVNFVSPWRSTNPLVSDVYRGWYLDVSYTADGQSSVTISAILERKVQWPFLRREMLIANEHWSSYTECRVGRVQEEEMTSQRI